jgi:hypothetical protein
MVGRNEDIYLGDLGMELKPGRRSDYFEKFSRTGNAGLICIRLEPQHEPAATPAAQPVEKAAWRL